MGAYTCEFGTVHKMCRCPQEHRISCPTPGNCKGRQAFERPAGEPVDERG